MAGRHRARRALLGGAALALMVSAGAAQSRYATSVVSYNQGPGNGLFDPSVMLGGPQGGGLFSGSLDVLTLGQNGDVTLGFDVTIVDGPGADLTVYENGFGVLGSNSVFAEVGYVEVSTNGVDFARFPSRVSPPTGPYGSYAGLAGGTPIVANVVSNSVDPFDPVEAGGDSFDLAELASEPAVLSGLVDLDDVHFVRIVDAAGGALDSNGQLISDAGEADFDAVAVIQHAGNQSADGPTLDLWRDAQGFVHLRLADPDGLSDLDSSTLRASINLIEVPFFRLRAFMNQESATANELKLVSKSPIASFGYRYLLGVSVADQSGNFSGDQLSLNP